MACIAGVFFVSANVTVIMLNSKKKKKFSWAVYHFYLPQFSSAVTVLSTLPDNLGDSRFWTVSPGLQIRVENFPDNRRSLLFLVDLTLRP